MKKTLAVIAAAAVLSLQIPATASAATIVPASLTISNGVMTETLTLYKPGTSNLESSITSKQLSELSDGYWDVCLTDEQMKDLISTAEPGKDSWYSIDTGLYVSGFTDTNGNYYSSDTDEYTEMIKSISGGAFSSSSSSESSNISADNF